MNVIGFCFLICALSATAGWIKWRRRARAYSLKIAQLQQELESLRAEHGRVQAGQ